MSVISYADPSVCGGDTLFRHQAGPSCCGGWGMAKVVDGDELLLA